MSVLQIRSSEVRTKGPGALCVLRQCFFFKKNAGAGYHLERDEPALSLGAAIMSIQTRHTATNGRANLLDQLRGGVLHTPLHSRRADYMGRIRRFTLIACGEAL